METADLLPDRKTFAIFESYWPAHADEWPEVNEIRAVHHPPYLWLGKFRFSPPSAGNQKPEKFAGCRY